MILTLTEKYEASILNGAKKHEILKDKQNKWVEGKEIKAELPGSKEYVLTKTCTSVQSIEIAVRKNSTNYETIYAQIDKKDFAQQMETVASNNGDELQALLEYLYETADERPRVALHIFRGKIIHWTDLKY